MKYKTFKSLVLLFMLSAMASVVNAALIDNGITTLDDVTGLEWLDITETTGLSYNQVLSSTYVVNGGYRFATEAEIMGLYASAGGTGTQSAARTVENKAPSILLLGLMGCTSALIGVPCDGVPQDWTPAMWGASAQFIGLIDDVEATKGILSTRWVTHTDPNNSMRADVGAFLVRNGAPPSPTPGITVSTISTDTTEAGGTATFTVVLDSQPTASVSIDLSSSDSTEGLVTSTTTLVFDDTDWDTPQQVTVTGQNDGVVDGDIAYTIITAAAVSGDGGYSGMNADDVSVVNLDDDVVIIDAPPPQPGPATPVPTMSVWGLGILIALMGLIGFNRRRKI